MGNVVTNGYVKFICDQLRTDKDFEKFPKSDNNNKNKNNIRGAWKPFPCPE